MQQTTKPEIIKKEIVQKIPSVQQWIKTFYTNFVIGVQKSCEELALMVQARQDVFDEIIAADPRFNWNMLESLRKVGTGELSAELIFDPSEAARKLLALPPAQQKHIYNNPVKIVREIKGKHVIEEKLFTKMSRADQNTVLDREVGRLRTIEEQVAYVKAPTPSKRAQRFEILEHGERLFVLPQTTFERERVREILARMDAEALKSLPASMKSNQIKG